MRQALAATITAVAAAPGGLLIAAAGAVPAYAAAPAVPHGGHSHKITITAHRRAHAAHGIGPHTILPCAAMPGVAPASCGQQTITCSITAGTIDVYPDAVQVGSRVTCTGDMPEIARPGLRSSGRTWR